ncbi:hypothetical protein C0J52_05034 [Blattella germanica]|nr:hypothetical protein C0J52_05034 [Blattella germanica]
MECDESVVQYAAEAESVAHALETCEGAKTLSENEDVQQSTALLNSLLDHIASNKVAYFKSQQVGEPDLNFDQKRQIAEDILKRNPGQFLARFGKYLLSYHLDYFKDLDLKQDDYEVSFHLKELRRYHCKAKNEVDVKNRRYEALKKLVKEGSYFSEKEMKQRNPLLYHQLVGQYLTSKEIEDQKHADMAEIDSWVNLLLAQIERDQMECLRQKQKYDEEGAVEEMDTSDEDDDDDDDDEDEDDETNENGMESESCNASDGDEENSKQNEGTSLESQNLKSRKRLSGKEKALLKEEFVSNMYRSFLEGNDEDFDYSQVDLNPDYECLAVRTQDEEEKYFDSETPELVADDHVSVGEDDDELETYMKNLKPETTPSDLAGSMNLIL